VTVICFCKLQPRRLRQSMIPGNGVFSALYRAKEVEVMRR
jgi:hypothetical protein